MSEVCLKKTRVFFINFYVYCNMKTTIILTAIGSLAGFAYASFAGCDPSACFISSSTSTSTVVGAFAGLVVALPVNLSIKKK